ncbi:YfiR family protein [Psychromonas ossibalaenae]|uniref:YfiR family protein n=1 Tax=Psychromonas ossibalaenae TaxID=444922 RepID=UPI00036CF13C|nr:YfiR family protein [Psychromonas ossibalaenae]
MLRVGAWRLPLIFFCLLITTAKVSSASVPAVHTLESLKVAYMYNLAKFTRWPVSTWKTPESSFQFCVYGSGRVSNELQTLHNKKITGHSIVLYQPLNEADFSQCNALYIEPSEHLRYRYIISLINRNAVLTISDDGRFLRHGGLINLVEKDQRLRFEVNMRRLSQTELKLSSKLLKIAILVDKPR